MRQRIPSPKDLSPLSSSFEDHHEIFPIQDFITLRGRQLFKEPKRFYQDINISKNSTCETKPFALQRNIKEKKLPNVRKLGVRTKNKPSLSETKSNSSSSSRERLKRRFCENDFFTYPTKKEFGLSSSEDDQSPDMQSSLKVNLSNDIESILIDIYNKNISTERKRKRRLNKREQELKSSFKQFNEHYNILILQILSTQIKELIHKYKEKIFEIPEMNQIRQKYLQEKKHQLGLSTLNLTLPSLSPFKMNSTQLMFQMQNELIDQGVTKILLKELINIKRTLKKSSVEIRNIFQYPLSIIEQSAKSKFNIEQLQIEEYSKVLLNDELISNLLLEFKIIFNQINAQDIIDLIELVEEDKLIGQSEFTKFDKTINGKVNLSLVKEEKCKQKDKDKEKEKDCCIDSNTINNGNTNSTCNNNKNHKQQVQHNNKQLLQENKHQNQQQSDDTVIKNTNNTNYNNEPIIADLDELLKFIDSDDNEKKRKKKRNKKNKKPICDESTTNNNADNATTTPINSNSNANAKVNDPTIMSSIEINDKEIELFRNTVRETTLLSCLCQKTKPNISQQWLNSLTNMTINNNKLNKYQS